MQQPLKLTEIVIVSISVAALYVSLLYIASHVLFISNSPSDFWGFLPSVWDHPEPNYIFSYWIAEFFSVLTALPIAGYLLMYNAWKYNYTDNGHSYKVLGLYIIICCMYSFAFFAHSTLSPLLMGITLTSVLTNGVYTFYHYSPITQLGFLQSSLVRFLICIAAESCIIYAVIRLPSMLGEFGGVPTLTVVQTPAVALATILVHIELKKLAAVSKDPKAKAAPLVRKQMQVYQLLFFSGLLLCAAMGVSFVEIAMSRKNVNLFGSFPYLHVTIHILEQIGIYNYGIGVSYLHYGILCNETKSTLDYCGKVPYVHRRIKNKKTA